MTSITRQRFPKPFSRDVAAGCQHQVISLHQFLIPAETDVGGDRKRPKLPQNRSVPLVPRAARSKGTCHVPQGSCLSQHVQDPPFSGESKEWLELEANDILGGDL